MMTSRILGDLLTKSCEWALYIYIGQGSISMEQQCCATTPAQKGQTSIKNHQRFMFLHTVTWIWKEAPKGQDSKGNNQDKEEEIRGISVCWCWITNLKTQILKIGGSYSLFSTDKKVWMKVLGCMVQADDCHRSNTHLEKKGYERDIKVTNWTYNADWQFCRNTQSFRFTLPPSGVLKFWGKLWTPNNFL